MKNHFFAILESFVLPLIRGFGISLGRMYRFFHHRPRTAMATGVIVLGGIIGLSFLFSPTESVVPPTTRSVILVRAGDASTSEPLALIGEVRSVKEALVSPDSSGTIANVYRSLGDSVGAGAPIASLKNDRERAAVTQAEAALAKAKASAAISGIGVGTAGNTLETATKGALTAIQSARTTISDSVLRRTDEVFANPTNSARSFSVTAPAFQLIQETVAKRATVQNILDAYAKATEPSGINAIIDTLQKEQANASVVHDYLDTLSQTLGKAIVAGNITESDIANFRSEANASLSAVAALETSLSAAEQSLKNAEAGVSIANQQNTGIGGENADIIGAQAVLQNAQIALDRTIIRAPISGTINQLDLNIGDFVAAGSRVAYITNNAGLEVVAYLGSRDIGEIVRGAKATIEGTALSGVVTRVATALDPLTKKAEVRVSLPEGTTFVPGQSVTLSIERKIKPAGESVSLYIPLTTVKLTPEGAAVFTVSASSTLESHAITLGMLQGSRVQIIEGLNPDWKIVSDVRGLSEGEVVIVNE